ncbi:MAG: hypothetical protein Q4B43_02085 [Bacteroidota bacterium]|nr:hypothetical protein [Bacteroidota bacterium]
MKRLKISLQNFSFTTLILLSILLNVKALAQETQSNDTKQVRSADFWQKVYFGGGIGASFSANYSSFTLVPSAIYQLNEYIALGVGLQGSYTNVNNKNFNSYKTFTYGGSFIVLGNPIPEVQLSAELEQLRINYESKTINYSDNFWNTALFLGGGYRTNNVTIGIRYNVLHKDSNNIYQQAFMPFVRIYF